jgi:hypothetical protein
VVILTATCPECGELYYSPFDKEFLIANGVCYLCYNKDDEVERAQEALIKAQEWAFKVRNETG